MMSNKLFLILFFLCGLFQLSCSDDVEDAYNISDLNKFLNWEKDYFKNNLPVPEISAPEYYHLVNDLEIEDSVNSRIWLYNVLTPSNFNPEEESEYPVLYLLHGKGNSRNSWEKSMKIKEIMDYCHEYFDLPDLIVIMPDAEITYYLDDFQEDVKYETFFIDEFIPYIENNYKVSPSRSNHFIGGFSMGGYGSAYYAMKYPDLFSLCYSMSGPLDGKGRGTTVNPISDFYNPGVYSDYPFFIMDEGIDDYFIEGNIKTTKFMETQGLNHFLILRSGAHTSQFWRESLFLFFSNLKELIEVI